VRTSLEPPLLDRFPELPSDMVTHLLVRTFGMGLGVIGGGPRRSESPRGASVPGGGELSLTLFLGNGIGLLFFSPPPLLGGSWIGEGDGGEGALRFITDSDSLLIPGNLICLESSSKLADQFLTRRAFLLARVESPRFILIELELVVAFHWELLVLLLSLFSVSGEEDADEFNSLCPSPVVLSSRTSLSVPGGAPALVGIPPETTWTY